MAIYKVRPDARSYGHTIGILQLDRVEPNIPGDVANASTYGYPVLFQTVHGVTARSAWTGNKEAEQRVVETAIGLENIGVKGIASNCGFMLHFQKSVAKAVHIPVFLSSLMQIPIIASSMSPARSIGIITATSEYINGELLDKAGVTPQIKVNLAGLQDMPEFNANILNKSGIIDSEKLQNEISEVAKQLIAQNPETGAILLECAVLPPYAAAVQEATQLPIFDFITMIDFFFAALHHRPYKGYY